MHGSSVNIDDNDVWLSFRAKPSQYEIAGRAAAIWDEDTAPRKLTERTFASQAAH